MRPCWARFSTTGYLPVAACCKLGPMQDYLYHAKWRVIALISSLRALIDRDVRVQSLAIPVVAAALEAIKRSKPDDPVVVRRHDCRW